MFLFGSCNFLVGCHVFGECPPGESSTVVHLKNQTESCDECPQVHIIVFYAPALGWSWWSIGNPWKPIARPFIQASSISVCTKRGWNSTWLIMGLNARLIDKSKMEGQRKPWKWTTSSCYPNLLGSPVIWNLNGLASTSCCNPSSYLLAKKHLDRTSNKPYYHLGFIVYIYNTC